VTQLRKLLPICCYCHKVRNDQNYWEQVDRYFATSTEIRFSHGICPDCWKSQVEPQMRQHGIQPGEPGP
jgi:hypothetical protein